MATPGRAWRGTLQVEQSSSCFRILPSQEAPLRKSTRPLAAKIFPGNRLSMFKRGADLSTLGVDRPAPLLFRLLLAAVSFLFDYCHSASEWRAKCFTRGSDAENAGDCCEPRDQRANDRYPAAHSRQDNIISSQLSDCQ